jgi:hypothetical protein
MHFRPDGTIETLTPDNDRGAGTPGITELTLDAFAAKREAQEFNARMNADPEQRDRGGYHFKMKDGGYLRFDRVDFGDGAHGIEAFVSAENAQLQDATLEIRLDNPAGEIIGSIPVTLTGGNAKYALLTASAKPVRGTHTVFLLAHGRGGDAQGHLFNVAWFTFVKTEQAEVGDRADVK